jgi:hypothetical protein
MFLLGKYSVKLGLLRTAQYRIERIHLLFDHFLDQVNLLGIRVIINLQVQSTVIFVTPRKKSDIEVQSTEL